MEILKQDGLDEYREFIGSHPKGHFMQSPEWGAVKNEWKWRAVVQRGADGGIVGALGVLIRKVPGLPFSLLYAPRGPVCDPDDRATLEALIGGVRELARVCRGYSFKIDPDIPVSNTKFRDTLLSMGFTLDSGGKNFESIQPRFVFRLDVGGKTEEQLMAGFHSKTRYNIRLAVRNGVTVKICGKEKLDEFLPIMRQTGERDGFATRPKAYFERMMDAFGDRCRLYMAYTKEGLPIAGTVAVQYAGLTWYLYGASSNAHRNLMPNYLLQWEMIRWAVAGHCRVYDFRGVSGDLSPQNPLYGLYRFKKGFGGELVEFPGEFNLVLHPAAAALIKCGARTLKKLRHMKNRRHAPGPKR